MPGLSGLELAAVLANFTHPPAVVFVTAHEDKAVAAFDVGAIDYLLKPLRARIGSTKRCAGWRRQRRTATAGRRPATPTR